MPRPTSSGWAHITEVRVGGAWNGLYHVNAPGANPRFPGEFPHPDQDWDVTLEEAFEFLRKHNAEPKWVGKTPPGPVIRKSWTKYVRSWRGDRFDNKNRSNGPRRGVSEVRQVENKEIAAYGLEGLPFDEYKSSETTPIRVLNDCLKIALRRDEGESVFGIMLTPIVRDWPEVAEKALKYFDVEVLTPEDFLDRLAGRAA